MFAFSRFSSRDRQPITAGAATCSERDEASSRVHILHEQCGLTRRDRLGAYLHFTPFESWAQWQKNVLGEHEEQMIDSRKRKKHQASYELPPPRMRTCRVS